MKLKLYPQQEECITRIIKGFQTRRAQCLAWYTGAGKTNIFLELCARLIKANPGIKIGISAYLTSDIKDQIFERAKQFDIPAFNVTAGTKISETHNLYIFNPQSIYKKGLPFSLDYLIVDESHAALTEGTKMLRLIMKRDCTKDTKLLLVTATPWDVLALKEFEGIPVFKRPLDAGLTDGLITDFTFHAEEAQVTFDPNDFLRSGELKGKAVTAQMSVLKSACIGKLHHLIKKYDKQLGDKVLVICPPGNISEVARTLALEFGGLCFLQRQSGISHTVTHWKNTDDNLRLFRENPKIRFLFVVNKCSVGFDMKKLTSVVDLTMSRNIKVLAQRTGRIARKNGAEEKHYFYCYDKSLLKNQLEWLIATMIDFCLGAYDGWKTNAVKSRETRVSSWSLVHPYTTTLKEIVRVLREPALIENKRTLRYLNNARTPTKWTLENAKAKMATYSSRTELWAKEPGLYKWFRHNAKAEMDHFFPFRYSRIPLDEKAVIQILKKIKFRIEMKTHFPTAREWIKRNKRQDLMETYGPPNRSQVKWTEKTVTDLLKRMKTWAYIRSYAGARRWMSNHGGEAHWKRYYLGLVAPKPGRLQTEPVRGQVRNRCAAIAAKIKKRRTS